VSVVTRRDLSRAETHRLVVSAARALFFERGFEATSTREIAERAGVAVGTVFKHFPDKDALLAGVLLVELDAILADAWVSLPGGPLLDRLMHFVRALYGFYARNPDLSRALVRATTLSSGQASTEASAQIFSFLGGVAGLVNEAQAAGELRSDLDPMAVTRVFFGTYLLVLYEHLGQPAFDADAAAHTLHTALQHAVVGWSASCTSGSSAGASAG
jgi:AcrR family transcriptional regulator